MEESDSHKTASSAQESPDVSNLPVDRPTDDGRSAGLGLNVESTTLPEAAHQWFDAGLSVIPLVAGTKQSATRWDSWLAGLGHAQIDEHWKAHPAHEVGLIVGDGLLVLDADSPASIAALLALERQFGLESRLVVRTRRGEHHYYRRAPGTFAKTNCHGTDEHPERIDIKTGRALVVLPPSTGKSIVRCDISTVADLTEVDQAFIDAAFRHNGADPPRPLPPAEIRPLMMESADVGQVMPRLAAMVYAIDPDCSYDEWFHIQAAVHHETAGSEDGFVLVNEWSSRGRKYCGEVELRARWRSFEGYTGTPVTMGTIITILNRRGVDWIELCAATEPDFEPCDYEAVDTQGEQGPVKPISSGAPTDRNVFVRFSLKGKLEALKREVVEQRHLLDQVALMGQATVLYAAPNCGKTLLTLWMLIQAIVRRRVDPTRVFYVNVDDSLSGLVTKLELAEEHRFHMLSEGYEGFSAKAFLHLLTEATEKNQAKGTVIILDTLKKFTDTMDKRTSAMFGRVMRRFILKGGTAIMLAHTNKAPDASGRPIYSGVADIVEDMDCCYVLRVISERGAPEKVVEFENMKRRGDVTQRVAFAYSGIDGLTYRQLLDSVRRVDGIEIVSLAQAADRRADQDAIQVVQACIKEGFIQRMALAGAIRQRTGCSRQGALDLIDRYSGTDRDKHFWTFKTGERGAKLYSLLESIEDKTNAKASSDSDVPGDKTFD